MTIPQYCRHVPNLAPLLSLSSAFASGLIDIEELDVIEKRCLGSTGACGEMFTASSMAACFEAMGISPPNSSCGLAVKEAGVGLGEVSEDRINHCKKSVYLLMDMMRNKVTVGDIVTRKR